MLQNKKLFRNRLMKYLLLSGRSLRPDTFFWQNADSSVRNSVN